MATQNANASPAGTAGAAAVGAELDAAIASPAALSNVYPLGANTYPAGEPFKFEWKSVTNGVTTNSVPLLPSYSSMNGQNPNVGWHCYCYGIFGSGGTVQIEYSPDGFDVSDANSNWFAPSTLLFSAAGSLWFSANFRKMRVVVASGDSTTNINVKVI